MAEYKVNLFCSAGKYGWSETYYATLSDDSQATALADSLAQYRVPLLGEPARVDYYRVELEGAFRHSTLAAYQTQPPWDFNSKSDHVWTAGLVELLTVGEGLQRPLYLRGLPDSVYDQTAPGNPDAVKWFTRLNQFKAFLTGSAWNIKRKIPNTVAVKEFIDALALGSGTGNLAVTVTNASTPPVPGKYVTFYKVKNYTPPIGTVRVTKSIGPLSFEVARAWQTGFNYTGGAFYTVYAPQYVPITDSQFVRFTHRDTGRPFGLSRGRRRAIPRLPH